jgi:hypothetical protein
MFPDAQAVWHWRDGVDDYRHAQVGSMGVIGYNVEATDGRIGTIDEASAQFGVNCLVVDTDAWINGRKVLVPAGTVRKVDRTDRVVYLDRTKADVKDSPGYNPDTFTRPQYRDHVAYYFAGTYRHTPTDASTA